MEPTIVTVAQTEASLRGSASSVLDAGGGGRKNVNISAMSFGKGEDAHVAYFGSESGQLYREAIPLSANRTFTQVRWFECHFHARGIVI